MTPDKFKQLARRAAGEEAPRPDVVPAVMARISALGAAPAGPPGWAWGAAAVAAAAAVVCAWSGLSSWATVGTPFDNLMNELTAWGMI